MTDPRPLSAISDNADVVVFSIGITWYWRNWWVEDEDAEGPFDSADEAFREAKAVGKTPYLDIPF